MGDDEDIFLFTAKRDEHGNLVNVWRMPPQEARRRTMEERERLEARFRAAPFPLYGLPLSWQGPRFLGGGSWGSSRGRERTKSLSLIHGTPFQGKGPMLAIETGSESSPGGGGLLTIAGMVWEGRSASVEEAIAERAAGEPNPNPPYARAARTELAFSVDALRTSFDAFVDRDEWVARAEVGNNFVTVEGYSFEPTDVALVHITDLEPYIFGTRRLFGPR